MLRIAYLDCFSGISGDMFLGALVDAGIPAQLLEQTVAALGVGADLEISRVERSGIAATKVDVLVHGEKDLPRGHCFEPPSQHAHRHEENQGPDHDHGSAHHHSVHSHGREGMEGPGGTPPTRPPEHGRGLKEIRGIIGQAVISEGAKKTSIAIFEALGAAEAKIHGIDIEKIHFHEVGAVDALVDIVCAAVGVEALGVDEIVCSPLNVGGGTVQCAHGTFPVPAPATVELLRGAPVYSSGLQAELVTPTGAAVVKTLASRFSAFPEMKIDRAGYGAGRRDFPGHANVARLTVGQAMPELSGQAPQETVTVLEANLDDLNPQVFGYVMERLLEAGALDVFAIPAQMKKNRPGTLLSVLAKPEDAAGLTQIIFAETTTLGVRRHEETRWVLRRRWVTAPTRWGEVRMKIAAMNGTVTNYAPEYEDCRRIAAEHRVPLKTVMNEAVEAYLRAQGKNH